MLFSRIIFSNVQMIFTLVHIAAKFFQYHVRIKLPETVRVSASFLGLISQVLQVEFPLMTGKSLYPINFSETYVTEIGIAQSTDLANNLFDRVIRVVSKDIANTLKLHYGNA